MRLPSPRKRILELFRSGIVVRLRDHGRALYKGAYGERVALLDSVGQPIDMQGFYANNPTGAGSGNQYIGCANWNVVYHLKNWSTYAINFRISWWKCRQKVVLDTTSGVSDIGTFYANGFQYPTNPPGKPSMGASDPSAHPRLNKQWCNHFKMTHMRQFRLSPYKTKTMSLRYPGVMVGDLKGNIGIAGGNAVHLAMSVARYQGLSTRFILIEGLGDLNPDGGTFPATVLQNSPTIFSLEIMERVDLAFPESEFNDYLGGDPIKPAITSMSSINPFTWQNGNLTGGSVGTTPIAGLLTNGL